MINYVEELSKKQRVNILYTDSESAIKLVKSPVYHSKIKHIKRRYYFTHKLTEEGDMCLEKIDGAKNPTDILTKYVDVWKLTLYKALIDLVLGRNGGLFKNFFFSLTESVSK